MKIKFKIFAILIATLSFAVLLPSLSLAAINCQGTCDVGECSCIIGECSSGLFDVYESSSCSGTPIFEIPFASRSFSWYPSKAGSYYMQVLCDDGTTKSACTTIAIRSAEETTTTTEEESTTTTTSTTGGGDNTWLIILAVLIIIAIVAFLLYRFFFSGKKGPRKTYEELYRKWSSRPGQ